MNELTVSQMMQWLVKNKLVSWDVLMRLSDNEIRSRYNRYSYELNEEELYG